MYNLMYISLLIVISLSTSGTIIAQDIPRLEVKYVFWSPPKYSIDGKNFESTIGIFATNFKSEFLEHFDENEEEYRLIKKARMKFNVGNWLMALPAGICLGIAFAKESGKTPFIVAASLLALGDIFIGISGYHDLSEAVNARNMRLSPNISIVF